MFGDGSLTFVLSTRAEALAGELQAYLHERFQLAVRVRAVAQGIGYRLYQLRKPKNRHLVLMRSVEKLPACNRLRKVLILTPPELIAQKMLSVIGRPKTPKAFMDAARARFLQ